VLLFLTKYPMQQVVKNKHRNLKKCAYNDDARSAGE
jgi:hypothetical protein